MRLLTRLFALFMVLPMYLHGQQKVAAVTEISNPISICAEICNVTATTGTNVVYQFGVGTTWNKSFTAPKFPLVVNCGIAADCALLGGDPISGVVKTLVVQQQASSFTVTYTTAGSTTPVVVPVPALPVNNTVTFSLSGFTVTVNGVTATVNATCTTTPTVTQ